MSCTMPNRLRLDGGRLEMIDGSDPSAYLQSRAALPDGTHVVVMNRNYAEALLRDAEAYRLMQMTADQKFAIAA